MACNLLNFDLGNVDPLDCILFVVTFKFHGSYFCFLLCQVEKYTCKSLSKVLDKNTSTR